MLPFAVIERDEGKAEEFPLEMTLATILADVEKQRERAGLLRRREEALEFASLLYWPVIVTPWRENRHLVFDGMGVWSYVFPQGRIPETRTFLNGLEMARDHRGIHTFLNERGAYFDNFAGVEHMPILGLFIHEEFMLDVLSHLALGKPRELRGNPVLRPRLTPDQAEQSMHKIRGLIETMMRDSEALSAVEKALESSLGRARKELEELREKTAHMYARKIEVIQPDVNAQVAKLEREREEKWAAMQPKLLDFQAQVQKAEADLAMWDAASRNRDDPTASQRARERRDVARREVLRTREQVDKYREEMTNTRTNYDRQVQAQWERIRSLERERDAEIQKLFQEEQAVVALVSRLTMGVRNLSKKVAEGVQFLESQGVAASIEGTTLVNMPIMVAGLASDRGRRMIIYPPMVARSGKGVLGGLKTAFGGAVLPLEPKTERFEELFRDGIEKALAEDASLAAYLTSVGNANNILHLGNLKPLLTKGLGEMKAQGWIKDKHERKLLQNLERHIAAASRTMPKAGQ